MWALGGGYAGTGIGLEWREGSVLDGAGSTISRAFDAQGNQTGYQATVRWTGKSMSFDDPRTGGYLIKGNAVNKTALYFMDGPTTLKTGGWWKTQDVPTYGGTAPFVGDIFSDLSGRLVRGRLPDASLATTLAIGQR